MEKAFGDEMGVVKSIMEFHAFQEQLFGKDRVQRIQMLAGDEKEEKQKMEEIQS